VTAPNSFSKPLCIAIFEIGMAQYPRMWQLAYEDAWFPGTKNKTTQKDVLQHNFEAGTPTIEKSCLQGAKHQVEKKE
jgi:hypothetical protein